MFKLKYAALIGVLMFLTASVCYSENIDTDLAIRDNRIVSIHYTLYTDGNKIVETTRGKKPLMYVHGKGQLLEALEDKLEGLRKGQKISVIIEPKNAYGEVRKDYFVEVPIEKVPENSREKGKILTVTGSTGEPVTCELKEIKDDKAVLDFNHPLAGKTLRYRVEIIDVKDKMQFG